MAYILMLVTVATLLKILLTFSYTSTDFEVHRNWLAITHSLPPHKWYFENTSEWTLDYPPFFAWFEWALSHVAALVDREMLDINNLNYKSDHTLYFQRGSVIVTEFVLLYACYRCSLLLPKNIGKLSKQGSSSAESRQTLFMVLIAFSCGLIIVDHIHFQYNGFLFGILFLSFANLIEGNTLWSAFWFAVLLNFKHIFLYIAPAYGVFLLRTYCFDRLKCSWDVIKSFSFIRLFSLAFVVLTVFLVSFGPFIYCINQVISRLFPFKRGLTHAYWAPNFWAMYNTADKLLAIAFNRFGLISLNATSSSTSGLVQNVEHAVLPNIPPWFTFVLTFVAMLPCLAKMWYQPCVSYENSVNQFLRSVVLCSLSSFMFGWHVHEKAIIISILPYTLLAVRGTQTDARFFLFLQAVGHYSLFPLLFTSFETVIKMCLCLLYSVFAFSAFGYIYGFKSGWKLPLVSAHGNIYLYSLLGLEFFCSFVFPLLPVAGRYEFLPLMLRSFYCAIGTSVCWLKIYYHALVDLDANNFAISKVSVYKKKN
ncbi:dolichyl pyrophosphate Glc1Man9GlcNAc2 alpha-1,3-glucosyltransferase-like [Clavelina lepadiformis]|uniref:dolichyl pyrophosphate Glc1Man9GlcNAc2 alpha-1,3-glucosyltransferase-like n=1 Tax=Clavelina lepadiformis TaxID=159417 RepID=UPI0040413B86